MRSVALFSGGKDSFMAATIALEQGMEIEELITVLPVKDSYMYHYPNASMAKYPAMLLNIPWVPVSEDRIAEYLAIKSMSGVECVISGAIESEYQKTRIERMCVENGMLSFNPLWRKSHDLLLDDIFRRGIRAIIVSVSAEGLGENFLGKELQSITLDELRAVHRNTGISIIGEGGEYETFVTGWAESGLSVIILKSHTEMSGSAGYLSLDEVTVN